MKKSNARNHIIVIPRHLVTIRFIDVPSTDELEIEKMVEFQALKEIPYSRDEIVVGYRILGSFKDGYSSIMLVIAKRALIQEKMREKEAEGVKVESIKLHSELLHLFLLKNGTIAKDKVSLIIYIGKVSSEIMVIDNSRPIFSRGFENTDRFIEEVDRSILVYKRDKSNPNIEHIAVVYTEGQPLEKMEQFIEEHFGIPASFIEHKEDIADTNLQPKIELLPREVRDKKLKLQEKYETLFTYFLVGLILILFSAFLCFKFYEKNRFFKMLSSKVVELESEVSSIARFEQKTEIAKAYTQKGNLIIGILNDSYGSIPSDISISGLDYDGENTISYKGLTKESSAVFAFVKVLEKLKYFDKVEIKYTAKKKIKGEEWTDFDIRCSIHR